MRPIRRWRDQFSRPLFVMYRHLRTRFDFSRVSRPKSSSATGWRMRVEPDSGNATKLEMAIQIFRATEETTRLAQIRKRRQRQYQIEPFPDVRERGGDLANKKNVCNFRERARPAYESWISVTYRHQILRLSRPKFGLATIKARNSSLPYHNEKLGKKLSNSKQKTKVS